MVVWFYIALHYVDAVLSRNGYTSIRSHTDRIALLRNVAATREIGGDFIQLYEESKEARYLGTQYRDEDLVAVQSLFDRVRQRMRSELSMN